MSKKLDYFERLVKKTAVVQSNAYEAGYDNGMNGANPTNCDFRIFGSPESTREWERGKEQAEIDKEKIPQ